jgi:ABC-type sugar transport system substrate-binding protein
MKMSKQMECGRAQYRLRISARHIGVLLGLLAVADAAIMPARAASSDQILIGLVTKTEVNPYFVKLRQSATAQAEKRGAKLIARFGKFDGDNEGQVAAVEDLISAGVKGILITPNNSTGMLGIIKRAREKGILVIALDTATDPADAVDATLSTDNFQAGELQGEYAKKALGDKTPNSLRPRGAGISMRLEIIERLPDWSVFRYGPGCSWSIHLLVCYTGSRRGWRWAAFQTRIRTHCKTLTSTASRRL